MTEAELEAIEARNAILNPSNPMETFFISTAELREAMEQIKHDVPALIAEVRRLREETSIAIRGKCGECGRAHTKISENHSNGMRDSIDRLPCFICGRGP